MRHVSLILLIAICQRGNAQFFPGEYCSEEMCLFGQKHVACDFDQSCPLNARLVDLRPHIKLIVDAHNAARNHVANGSLTPFPPAARMASMRWDPELAEVAKHNVIQCKMEHDKCFKTDRFQYAGQNLAIHHWKKRASNWPDDELMQESVKMWFNEYKNTKLEDIELFAPKRNDPPIGHFTTLIWQTNNYVGCAASRWMTPHRQFVFLTACNYAQANMRGSPVYEIRQSVETPTSCQQNHPVYKDLCSTDEIYEYT